MDDHWDARRARLGPGELPADALLWRVLPVQHALAASAARQRRGPDEGASPLEPEAPEELLCTEVGRRLLLAQFQFSEWVLRRVEKVTFVHERRVSRRTSIELRVPEGAPVVVGDDGVPHWLVPLSVMRRRTLVNLDLRDEEDRPISMLGLRFTQGLDESMLRAAALLAAPGELPGKLTRFIGDVVSGDWETVSTAKGNLDVTTQDDDLRCYFEDSVFSATLDRLWHNFTLYVTLPVPRGRHRLLRMAFDEPVDWAYQRGTLEPASPRPGETVRYRPFGSRFGWHRQLGALFGWWPTRIRFLTPSAENCASYHFEFTAPPGLRVTRARLLAGRPNRASAPQHDRIVSVDGVEGRGEMVGLHAVEIPNGSLCRAQVDLRISARGWLSTLLFSCLSIVGVLVVMTWYLQTNWPRGSGQATSLFVLLLTVSAGAATYVAQRDAGDVAGRMLTWLRGTGLVVITIPVLEGMAILFLQSHLQKSAGAADRWLPFFWWLVAAAALAAAVVLAAFGATSWAERNARRSPWDMTGIGATNAKPLIDPTLQRRTDYLALLEPMGFAAKAIGVHSSEGWHEVYGWDADKQARAVGRLIGPAGPATNLTRCACRQVGEHPCA